MLPKLRSVTSPAPPANDSPPPREARSGTRAGPLVGRTILVVDADADVRELVALFLARVGAAAVLAGDVDEALAHVELTLFDAVVTDVALPDRDGYALLDELRGRCPGMPVLALTGYLARPRSAATRGARFDAFLVKPFEPALLFARIAELLGSSR